MQGDIADPEVVARVMPGCQYVVNFAAETHVDRSLYDAGSFIQTDVYGTFVLLEEARRSQVLRRFVQISTDEVYGSVETGSSRETDALMPRNPYSASKAGADRLAYSYFATYGLPVLVTRASNNYGPYQFPEKVIPLFVTHAIDDIPLPLYGDGMNVRDWLHVDDHCRAVELLLEKGVPGETYNVGGGNEVPNIELTQRVLRCWASRRSLIRPVTDRPGHDRRYSVDCGKLRSRRLGARPCRSTRGCGRPSSGTASTNRGGVRSRSRTRRSATTTSATTRRDGRRPLSVLVTGVGGFVGGHVVDFLAAHCPAAGGLRPRPPRGERRACAPAAVTLLEADLEDGPAIDAAIDQVRARPHRPPGRRSRACIGRGTTRAATLRTNVMGC